MKDIIIHAAMEEIRMRGLRFTMQDLATRLKVSKRSLYENFSSKENLIDEMVDIILSDMTEEEHAIFARDIPIPEKVEALLTIHPYDAEMFNTNVYEDLKRMYPQQWQKIENSRLERQRHVEVLLTQGIEEGTLRPFQVSLIGHILKDAFESFTSYSFLAGNGLTQFAGYPVQRYVKETLIQWVKQRFLRSDAIHIVKMQQTVAFLFFLNGT